MVGLVAAPVQAQTCVEAVRAQFEKDQVEAEGHVRLRLPGCALRATKLRLTGQGLSGEQVVLSSAGGIRLRAHRLRMSDEGLQATFVHGSLCSCPSEPPLLTFSAHSARVASGSSRLHLWWPSLWLGNRRVLTLPYAALPLDRGVSGLLLPELGYSGRDGVRFTQGVYLVPSRSLDLLVEGGWIQQRGPVARTRLRYWWDGRGDGELLVSGLQDGDRLRGNLRGDAVVGGRVWAVGLAPDLVSDLSYAADMATDPGRVFAPYLRSRLWAWTGIGAMFVMARGDLLQDLASPLAGETSARGQVSAWAGLLPLALAGPLSLDLVVGVSHWEPWRGLIFEDPGACTACTGPGDQRAMRATSLTFSAGMNAATTVGPLRFSSRGAYRLLALYLAGASTYPGDEVLHRGTITAEASLPLARIFQGSATRYRHLLEPFVGALWSGGTAGLLLNPDGTSAREGGFGLLGLRTALLSRGPSGGRVRRPLGAELSLQWPLAGTRPGITEQQPFLGGVLRVRPPGPISGSLSLNWGLQDNELAELQGQVCLRTGVGLEPCVGYTRLRLEQVHGLYSEGGRAWLNSADRVLPLQLSADQVYADVRARWGILELGLQLAADPVLGRLTHGSAWMDLTLGCGCYRLGVLGQSRLGQDWPDVVARLQFTGSGARGGCGL